jgi:hypothetical protein
MPSAEAAKKRFRRWAKKSVFDRLMECSQPVAAPDVLGSRHGKGAGFTLRRKYLR